MHKTLHDKLTDKQSFNSAPGIVKDDIFATLRQERRILDALAKDVLQPRPEAVANILRLAKNI